MDVRVEGAVQQIILVLIRDIVVALAAEVLEPTQHVVEVMEVLEAAGSVFMDLEAVVAQEE
jgi:hypothetical protein